MNFSLIYLLTALAASAVPAAAGAQDSACHGGGNPWEDDYADVAQMENWRLWGTYNVHDPSCRKLGDYFYMYSTDAIYNENRQKALADGVPIGYVQVRRSRDLVNWEFCGWAFPEIPQEASDWVRSNSGGDGAVNVWAPYIIEYNNVYRLYYCVSAFGKNTSYIGLAESDNPEGPWTHRGCVVKTNRQTVMNAIDPSVIADPKTGKWWMHYGSFFGGLYCVELDPVTGLTKNADDLGHLTARRANWRTDNLEAPEIIYNKKLDRYFLFGSYDPLMTTYNVRVSRSMNAEGPFTDFYGQAVSDTTDNFPILTAPYRFEGHPGWAGTAHCGVFTDDDGNFFMAHQGRLSPQNLMMDLHIRQMFFTEDGWPVVSPERYAGTKKRHFIESDLQGQWEIIRVRESQYKRQLEAGQILWGEGMLKEGECNLSVRLSLNTGGVACWESNKSAACGWSFDNGRQLLSLQLDGETICNLIVFAGHDWERKTDTVLFTGLDSKGRSVWGKKI